VCIAMSFLFGIALLIVGLWGELYPPPWWPLWWKNLGYGLGMLASFTSFLIGVPVVLIVLESFKSNLAQDLQIESVNRISKAAWNDFAKAVADLCTAERINAVMHTEDDSSAVAQLQAEHDLIMETLHKFHDEIQRDSSSASKKAANLKAFLAAHAGILEEKHKV